MSNKTDALAILTDLTTEINGSESNESGYRNVVPLMEAAIQSFGYANALSGESITEVSATGVDNKSLSLSLITALTTMINDVDSNESGYSAAYQSLIIVSQGYDDTNSLN
jgi:hypothetical protein